MSDELKHIPNQNKDIEQEKLLDYLNRNMSDEAQHEFEKKMSDDEFMFDAVEGLEEVKDKKQLELLVHQLNNELKKQVDKKKQRKEKRRIKEQPWVYFTIVLLLLLIIVAYLVIKRFN